MDIKIDKRAGSEFGLKGLYTDVPAFQIINDSAERLAGFTSRIVALKYGPHAEEVRRHPNWPQVYRSKVDFSRRLEAIGGDAVAAAVLDTDIQLFELEVVDTLFAAFENSS